MDCTLKKIVTTLKRRFGNLDKDEECNIELLVRTGEALARIIKTKHDLVKSTGFDERLDSKSIMAKAGDVIVVPTGDPHRFTTGEKGGHAFVISPPDLEFYFWEVGECYKLQEFVYIYHPRYNHSLVFSFRFLF